MDTIFFFFKLVTNEINLLNITTHKLVIITYFLIVM